MPALPNLSQSERKPEKEKVLLPCHTGAGGR